MVQASEVRSVVSMLQERDLNQVPEEFYVPHDQTPASTAQNEVPVIDLSLDHDQIVKDLAKAASEWGCFVLINHGIKNVSKAVNDSTEFFELPIEEKLKFAASNPFQEDGYGSKSEYNYTAGNSELWRDFILLHTHPSKSTEKWPSCPSTYREVMAEFADEMLSLTRKLIEMLSEGLGMPPDFLLKRIGDVTRQKLLTNYYPACPQPNKVIGVYPHTDYGALTLLVRNQVPGLQVLKDDGWVMMQPSPNSIDGNIGDLLELMSNGRYKSVTHQVLVDKKKARLSIGSFFECSSEKIVSPLPELIDQQHPALYKSVKFGDTIVQKFAVGGKAYLLLD